MRTHMLGEPALNGRAPAAGAVARAPVVEFDPAHVPEALRDRPQWVAWKYIERDGKPTKCPFDPRSGQSAKSTDPSTWASFDEAVAAWREGGGYAGVGFVFAADDPFAGVDLDGCIDGNGVLAPAARDVIDSLNSYTEISPGGRGVKIIVAARKPEGARCRSKAVQGFKEVEVYDRGRFFAITGRRLPGAPASVEDRQPQLDGLCSRLWPKQAPPPSHRFAAPQGHIDDDALIARMRRARNGDKFAALFDRGEAQAYRGDESAADEALCCIIAFNTRDHTQIERLFSLSALGQREKWRGRPDYRERTINAALEFVPPPGEDNGAARARGRGATGGGATVTAPPERFPCTDLGNAERFAARFGDDVRYCHSLGVWFVWDGARWCEDKVGAPVRMAGETARGMLGEAGACDDDQRRGDVAKWAIASEHRARLEAMVALARSRPRLAVAIGQLDRDQWAFNTLSGTVNLRSGELRPHRREDLITRVAPVHYDPAAACPRFDAFLEHILGGDRAVIAYLQRFLGHCLSGGVELQVLPIFHGVGANGKSVLIDTVKWVMGDYACDAPPSLLVKTGRDEHPTEIADLLGRRLVVASETEDGAAFKLQLVKRLTGDASLKARRMREDFFEFERTHKIVMVTNNRPRVREDSEAVWRRLHLVPFEVVIPQAERDPQLLATLRHEAPGILAWLVRGCLECQRDGLNPPPAVVAATAKYRDAEDAVGRFIQERCAPDPDGMPLDERSTTPWRVIYDAYTDWCEASGEKALSPRRLGDALDKRGLVSDTRRCGGKAAKVRVGVRLIADAGVHGEANPC